MQAPRDLSEISPGARLRRPALISKPLRDMKLRKIEILGFKSFRAKTGIEIGDGITSVVGPNGCGKSNIVDAIRWAMGSQSPRDLRGRAMEDVIFNGSENHRPMGFAEVSLTFDNDPKTSTLPLEWRDLPSIKVTRRLFRSGESEYEINGSRARLRDIQDVFAGTGVSSRDAYSIIEQGKIGFIVASKPEERRVIIEEAAGITRYRNQRKLAERRLERTRDNLLRVSDVQREVARQLASLERQAARAAKAREIQNELREVGVILHAAALRQARAEHHEALRILTSMETRTEGSQGELARAEARVEEARLSLLQQEQRLNESAEAAYAARSRVELLGANLEHRKREQAQLLTRQQEAQLRIDEDAQKLADLIEEARRFDEDDAGQDDAREALDEEIDALEERVAEERLRASRAREALDEARRALSECERVLARTSTRADSIRADLRQLNDRQEESDALVIEYAERAEESRDKVSRIADDAADADFEHEAAVDEDAEARAAERSAREALDAARERTRVADDALRNCTAALDSVRRVLRSGAGVAEGARAVLQRANERGVAGVIGPLATRIRVQEGFEASLGAVLGELADAVLVDSNDAALSLLEIAREAGCSLMVVSLEDPVDGALSPWASALAPIPRAIAARLRATTVVEALGEERGGVVVDAKRFVSEGQGVFSFRAGEMAAEQLMRAQRELSALEDRLEALTMDEDDAQQAERRAEREFGERSEARVAAQERLAIAEDRRRKLRVKAEEARELAQHLERLLRRAREEAEDFSRRRSDLEADLAKTREESARALESRDALSDSAKDAQDALARLDSGRESLEERLTQLRVRRARLEAEAKAVVETRQRIAREIDATRERVAFWEKTIANAAEEQAALAYAVEREGEELERWKTKSVDADVSAAQERARHESMALSLRELEIALAETRRLLGAQLRDRESAALALERARANEVQEEERCVERFQLAPAELLAQAADTVATDVHVQRDRDLRERLERLGPVNPAAEDEYNAAVARHDFLVEQVDDLESALKDLDRAIRRMDKTCRDLFAKTFEQVNEGFQRMFPRLFRGGRAHLELTNPDDLLTTGVEIVAQPPGKKLQSIQLMSGGEKALTATALIFAIFELKPSPICILDEVDAPLDEANVGRFADMVREISDRSQFLVITHNTRTMEVADTLYGVTMEEPGVSRLVGVQLRAKEAVATA